MIERRVAFEEAHLTLIGALEISAIPLPDRWSDTSIAPVRAHIKAHYIHEQRSRCCFCEVFNPSSHHRLWDVEHIVPRKTHPQFIFTSENLAVACPDCNREKGDTQTLSNPSRSTYPNDSASFRIVHPHFDDYSDHIARTGVVYTAKTDKGSWTIKECNLLRFAQKTIDWDAEITDERYEAEVGRLLDGGPNAEAALAVILAALSQRQP